MLGRCVRKAPPSWLLLTRTASPPIMEPQQVPTPWNFGGIGVYCSSFFSSPLSLPGKEGG